MEVRFKKSTLPNGVRILSEEIPGFPTVSFGIWVNVGSRDETPEENGLTHFIEHMFFKGTETRSAQDIAKEMDRLGGYANAFTSRENTCLHAKVLPEDLPALVDLLSDIFLHSRFAPEDVEREKQIIRQEINMVEDSPEEFIHDLFSQFLWGENPLGRPVLGTKETISRFDAEKIRDYFERLYVGSRVVIAAAGDLTHEQLLSLTGERFSSLPAGSGRPRKSPSPASGVRIYRKDLEQVHFILGVPTPGARSPARYTALLFNTLLGGNMSSRLFQEIRERHGLAYAVYSYLSLYEDVGVLGIYAAVEKEDLRETLEIIVREIGSLMAGEIHADEFAAARDHLKSALFLSSDNPDSRMTRLARNEILYNRYISYEETLDKLKALTAEDLPPFARQIFRQPAALVVLGPVEEDDLELPEDLFLKG